MGIELSQFDAIQYASDRTVIIGYLPPAVASHLGCPLAIAYLSGYSLNHILKTHPDVTKMDLVCLTEAIKNGTWIADRQSSAVFLYRHPETGRQYKGALKVAGDGYETYVSTFHRCTGRQWAKLMKRKKIADGSR